MSFYVSTATFFLLHCDRVVALPRHKFVTGATLLQLDPSICLDSNFHTIITHTHSSYQMYIVLTFDSLVKDGQKCKERQAFSCSYSPDHLKFPLAVGERSFPTLDYDISHDRGKDRIVTMT